MVVAAVGVVKARTQTTRSGSVRWRGAVKRLCDRRWHCR